jgi:phosphate transport system substrate-binding protein
MSFKKLLLLSMTFSIALLGLAGCKSGAMSNPTTNTPTPTVTLAAMPDQPVPLQGAGGTFPAPLYTKWISEFGQLYGVQISYNAVGSSGGISDITAGSVDFGAADGLMTDQQVAAAEAFGGPILNIPMTSGSVAIIYNIDGVTSGGLKLSGPVLAGIFLKNITNWSDPAIAALNPGLNLPDAPITVVHRSDGSGTTNIFTNYLSKVSSEWATDIGSGFSVTWPGDVGGSGNAGVASQVQQIPNSIGYTELAYALQNNITFASMENASGSFVLPSLESTTTAAVGVSLPDDMKIMLTDSSNPDAYPIAGFTWILVYQNQQNAAKGAELVDFLWWAIHDGQSYATDLTYAPLSADATAKAEALIESITYQGQPLLKTGS